MELGCFNRPWAGCERERAFRGMAAAGFRYCGLLRHDRQPLLSAASTPEEAAAFLDFTRGLGLSIRCNLAAFPLDESIEAGVAQLEAEIDAAQRAGIPHLLTMGTSDPGRYETYFAILKAAAPYAHERGVTLGLKHHGGISATSRDCLAAVERIGTRGFGIWYDPGNIIHYTATSPEEDLEALAPHVVGTCVKDCAGGLRGRVDITPGDGEVDFARIFAALRAGGFDGPALVECLDGETPEQVDAEARRAHDLLLRWTGG